MHRHVVNVVACMLAGAGPALSAPPPGELTVSVSVDGEPVTEGCTVKLVTAGAIRKDAAAVNTPLVEGPAGTAVEGAAGKVDVVTECFTQNVKFIGLSENVKLARGATHKVAFQKGALIVHGVQGGSRVSKGEYALLVAGTGLEVARSPLGQRVYTAVGTYDLRADAEVEGEPCTVIQPGVQVKEGRPAVVQADLSQGQVELLVMRNGKPGEGAGAITLPGKANRIKEFSTGEPVRVAPGTYDVLASLESSFDFTEKRQRNVVVAAGKTTQVKLDMPRGSVTTRCEVDGREAVATVHGFLPGAEDFFNKAPCGQVLELSPGKYHFRMVMDGEKSGFRVLGNAPAPEVWHRNVVVKAGKDTPLVANWSPGRLRITASKNGTPVDAAVTVNRSGGATLGGGPAGEVLPVSPGRYDVEVLFPGHRTPTRELVRGVECETGKPCEVKVNIERAVLVLEVFRGGVTAVDADVLVYKEGSDVPYLKGRSGDELELPPGVWVPEVRAGGKSRPVSKMRLRPGDRETRQVSVD